MNKIEDQTNIAQVECCFGQNRFTSQQRFVDSMGQPDSPFVMEIVAISERHQEAGIGNPFHFFEKPLRNESRASPETLPAKRRNGRSSRMRAFSS